METTLIVIESDAELAHANALVEKLMASDRPADTARLQAQAPTKKRSGRAVRRARPTSFAI